MSKDETLDATSKVGLALSMRSSFQELLNGDTDKICQTYIDLNEIMHQRHNLAEGLFIIMMSLYNGASHLLEDEETKAKGIHGTKVLEAFIVIASEFLQTDLDALNALFFKARDIPPSKDMLEDVKPYTVQ